MSQAKPKDAEVEPLAEGSVEERPKVVYAYAPLSLVRLLGPGPQGGWRVAANGAERTVQAAEDVDPKLLAEVAERGGRVLLETIGQDSPRIAGVVQVRRALEIDAQGDVVATIRSLELRATKDLLLTTGKAMLWVKREDVELYGREVVTKAREVAKILGRMITLN